VAPDSKAGLNTSMVTVILLLESSYTEGFECSTQGYSVTADPEAMDVVGSVVIREIVEGRS
jgi:hypothetical protein